MNTQVPNLALWQDGDGTYYAELTTKDRQGRTHRKTLVTGIPRDISSYHSTALALVNNLLAKGKGA